jgi:hypothetical protein
MKKQHSLNTVVVDHIAIQYFYTKEKRDVNGNSRFRVYIMDPDAPVIYERIFKCYESQIPECVAVFVDWGGSL